MDVVYLCRDGENEELRYSLRSLKNIKYDDVWIFGGMPKWVKNVKFIPIRQEQRIRGLKHANTTMLLSAALDQVPGDFILMNDDFYIIENIGEVPLYNRGPIEDVINHYREHYRTKSSYMDSMEQTHRYLVGLGYETPLSFELHAPMPVYKDTMRVALEHGKAIEPNAHKRSIYGNLLGMPSETIPDVKVSKLLSEKAAIPDTPFLSTSDNTAKNVLPVFKYFFRKPSPFEG